MGFFKLTKHAEDRVNGRLSGLVTTEQVIEKVNKPRKKGFPKGRSYVEVAKFPYTEIQDPSVQPDGWARGDRAVAVVDNDYDPRITTVIIRKSWSKSGDY